MDWNLARWQDMEPRMLHDVMQLRQAVFVVEQDCAYLDLDGADLNAWHIWGVQGGEVVACARILAPGEKYPEASIGRVCTALNVRGTGVGRALMERAMAAAAIQFPGGDLRISAQSYLLPFYESLGFVRTGHAYLEDGIPHEEMHRAFRA
jgi:ElaA protein